MDRLTTVAELEDVVGAQPTGSMIKSIVELDHHCVDILAVARAAVIGTTGPDGLPRATVVGAPNGFVAEVGSRHLHLGLPDGHEAPPGTAAGLVFLVPGLGETLRLNGVIAAEGDGVETEEVYVHCAKAIIRSKLWKGGADADPTAASAGPISGSGPITEDVAQFLARAPFAVLLSSDADGAADASPKGDPAGFVRVIDERTVAVPDRPGNFRTDTWHNLVTNDAVGVLAMVPGTDQVVELRGRGRLTTDESVREPMAVAGKVPKLALVIDVEHAELSTSPGLAAAGLWDRDRHADVSALPRMSKVWADHVRLNRDPGAEQDLIRELVTAEAIEEGVSADYRSNLY